MTPYQHAYESTPQRSRARFYACAVDLNVRKYQFILIIHNIFDISKMEKLKKVDILFKSGVFNLLNKWRARRGVDSVQQKKDYSSFST